MRFSNFKGRKGIASVIGGLFFLVLMTSGFTVYYIALESQAEMINTQQLVASTEIKKIQEKFAISVAADSSNNNLLQIQVKNQGYYPIEIADVWIINKTDTNQPVTKYELDYSDAFIPAGYGGQILENTPLYMNPDLYDIKVVSILGTIRTAELDVVNNNNYLRAELYAIPPNVHIGENVTIAMHVTNVGEFTVENVAPSLPLMVNPSSSISSFAEISTLPVDLGPSESAFFTWHYTLGGIAGINVDLSNYATGTLSGLTIQSNTDSDSVRTKDSLEGELIVLNQDLLSRPEIFMVIPSPFGVDDETALWGVNVVNPTPINMNVSKVTISAITTRPQKQDKVFDEDFCNPITVAPTPNSWSCPAQNQIMWKDISNPLKIPPYSAFPFLVKTEPGFLAGAFDDLETVLIQADLFTTLGEFGKTGYGSSIDNKGNALVNVFLSTVPDSTLIPDIYSYKGGILASTPTTFHATLADFDSDSSYKIAAGAKLIINVPKDWTNVSFTPDTDFDITQQTVLTQTQIVGETNFQIQSGGKSITFTATPPCVENIQMFVMYILADGRVIHSTENDFSMGPLAEIVLQVVPNGPC
ncbi:MAG: Pilin/Flagellin, FlaG/FlaF family [Nitrosopumilales archaeon]|nr:MAG: Pilin/Flagellin, FlaG/FlaF family [Nitrosopumilales archaeon]